MKQKKLARKKTKGRSSGQADGATVRVKLKQGAYTTTLETVAAPSAVSEGPWGCCMAKCQQPRHQLRNCVAFKKIPVDPIDSKRFDTPLPKVIKKNKVGKTAALPDSPDMSSLQADLTRRRQQWRQKKILLIE